MRTLSLALAISLAACASDPVPPAPAMSASETADSVPIDASALVDTADAPLAADAPLVDELDAAAPAAGPPTPAALADWSGEFAVRQDGLRFVSDDAVRPKLVEAFSVEPGLLDRLEGDVALYDIDRVTNVDGMLAIAYRPMAASPDRRPLYLLVHTETGNVHAVLTSGDDTFYRRSYASTADDLTPEAVAWMQAQSNRDVMEMAIRSDQEVPGP